MVAVGATRSMLATVAVTDPVFQTASSNSKVNEVFPVNVYVLLPELLVMVIASDAPVRVATTFWLVDPVVE